MLSRILLSFFLSVLCTGVYTQRPEFGFLGCIGGIDYDGDALVDCDDPDCGGITCGNPNQLFRPSAFSPSGDGVNDVFAVFAPSGTVPTLVSYCICNR